MTREIELLKDVVFEIRQLRNQNDHMRTRLQMFDDMMILLRTTPPNNSYGMSEDIAWKIEKFIDSQNAEKEDGNDIKPKMQ